MVVEDVIYVDEFAYCSNHFPTAVVVVVEIGCSLWEELEQEWNLRAHMHHLRVLVLEIGTGIEELYVGHGGGSGCELLD